MPAELPPQRERAMMSEEFDIIGYVQSFLANEHFAQILQNYPKVNLGRNIRIMREVMGHEVLQDLQVPEEPEIETARFPILPFLRAYADMLDDDLVLAIRHGQSSRILVIPEDNVDIVTWSDGLGDRERLRLKVEDPYVNIDTEFDNPSLLRASDLAMLKNEHPGSGHGSTAGAYFRLALLDAVLRPISREHKLALVNNIISLARQCKLPPYEYARTLIREYA